MSEIQFFIWLLIFIGLISSAVILLIWSVFPKDIATRKAVFIAKDINPSGENLWYAKYEVNVVAESEDCYKIKRWWFSRGRWIPKTAKGIRIDFIK